MSGALLENEAPSSSTVVIARLNDRAQPVDRGELYDDPLDALLREHGVGAVTGGGTQLGKDNEIEFCDLEIQLEGLATESLTLVKNTLEKCGAPKGSKLILESPAQEVEFGLNEGLAVYLNGTDLPAHVYQECDVNFVYSEFNRLLGPEGGIHSHWQGPRETALYMYGPSFETMKQRLASFLDTYPLCQRARVIRIA